MYTSYRMKGSVLYNVGEAEVLSLVFLVHAT